MTSSSVYPLISVVYPLDMTRHTLTQGFGENPEIYKQFIVKGFPLQGHNGQDFAPPNVQRAEIYAAATGKVKKIAYEAGGFGLHIWLQHQGFRTLYAHLSQCLLAESLLAAGRELEQGTTLGYTGSTGFSTGIHLHFGLYPDGEPVFNGFGGAVDPSPYYGEGRIYKPNGTMEYAINPTGNSIFILRPNKWRTPAKARRK